MPTKDMPAKSDLRCHKPTIHTDRASNKLFDPKHYKLNLLPLMSFGKSQIPNLLISRMRKIDHTSQFGPQIMLFLFALMPKMKDSVLYVLVWLTFGNVVVNTRIIKYFRSEA